MVSKNYKQQVSWEDDFSGFEKSATDDNNSTFENNDFETLLEDEDRNTPIMSHSVHLGEKVLAHVSYIGESENIILEFGIKKTATISKQELTDETGHLTVKVGDTIEAYVVSKEDGILLSKVLSAKMSSDQALEAAIFQKMPVRGKVLKDNKGGYEVSILGNKAFCPFSQIDILGHQNPSLYLGKEFDFVITGGDKKNLVVSRTVLLRKAGRVKLEEILRLPKEEWITEGVVTDFKPFGAFVDLGGLVGMIHISQMSFARIQDPKEVLSLGQTVKVKILEADMDQDKPKISLSLKDLEQDPWKDVHGRFHVGDSCLATITKLMKFGAFAQLQPGLEGLIPLSEMSWTKRIHDPSALLKVGEEVQVRILDIDESAQRISLSLKDMGKDPWKDALEKFTVGSCHQAVVERLKPFGAIVILDEGVSGLVPNQTLQKAFGSSFRKKASPPNTIEVKILSVDQEYRKILLSLPEIGEEGEDQRDFLEYLASAKKENEAQVLPNKALNANSMGSFGQLLEKTLKK